MLVVLRFVQSVVILLTITAIATATDEAREPPLKYRLEIDGRAFTIAEGESLKLSGVSANPTVKLEVEPHREFTYGGVSFLYPRSFGFEADVANADSKRWTLSGNDLSIMYSVLTGKVTPDEFADTLTGTFGKKNCRRTQITSDLLGTKRAGVRLNVILADHKMTIDIICVPSGDCTRLFVVQDSPDDSGQPSKESRDALPLLKKSVSIK